MPFDGFISYSHAADGKLAPAVQRGLHRLAKPWHRRRALWIFRDQTGLAVTPGLWSSIQHALDSSEWFVLMASPEAARSQWVNREIEHWVATKSGARILPVVTDGEWAWDPARGDFSEGSTSVPAALRGVFAEEPLYLDLRWARDDQHLSLRHSRFRDAIAQLASPMHGVSKDDLEGEDVRQHQMVGRLRTAAVTTVVVLGLVASLAGVMAVRNGQRASAAAAEALHQQHVATQQKGNADKFANQAQAQEANARTQEKRAKEAAAEAQRQEANARAQADNAHKQQQLAGQAALRAQAQERVARQQRAVADQAGADARQQKTNADDQQRLAKQATAEAARQKQLAVDQQKLAEEAAKEAERQKQAADEQQKRAEQATEEAHKQQANAERQQRIAIGRRLTNQAKATIDRDPQTALMLGLAARKVQPDAEAHTGLTSMITSTRFEGAFKGVQTVAYSADGVLATGGDKFRTVTLWNLADPTKPTELATFPGGTANALAFSPDGRTLAVIGGSSALWNVTDRRHPTKIGPVNGVERDRSIAFSQSGRMMASGRYDGTVTVWDMADWSRPEPLSTVTIQAFTDFKLLFSPDERTLVTDAAEVILWDLTNRADPVKRATLDAHGPNGRPAKSVAFSPDGSTLITGDVDGRVIVWDAKEQPSPGLVGTLPGHSGAVRSLAFSPDGKVLASGDGNGAATLWDVESLTVQRRATVARPAPDHGAPIEAMAFSPDGRTLVTAGKTGLATLWSTAGHGALAPRAGLDDEGFDNRVLAMSYRPDGRTLATAHANGTAMFWDVTDPDRRVRIASVSVPVDASRQVAFSPDGRTKATGAIFGRPAKLTDVTDPTRPVTLATFDETPLGGDVLFSSDGQTVAFFHGRNGSVMLWDLTNPRRPQRIAAFVNDDGATACAFSLDGHTMAVSSINGAVTLWDVAARPVPARLTTMKAHSSYVASLAFSPDGSLLATGGQDKTATLWKVTDRAKPERLATLDNETWLTGVRFSPDGQILAAEMDTSVQLWQVSDPTSPARLSSFRGRMTAFSPDQHTLAADGGRLAPGKVSLWDYTELNQLRADPAKHACAIAGRGLTADEWARYIPELPYQPTCPG